MRMPTYNCMELTTQTDVRSVHFAPNDDNSAIFIREDSEIFE